MAESAFVPNASMASPQLAPTLPTQELLNAHLGKNIKDICTNGYVNNSDNHCAHFVSHALGFDFGYTCKGQTGGKGPGANLRVHEIFSRCLEVGLWASRPASLACCLAFVIKSNNVNLTSKTMTNVPKKHIGVFLDSHIWHYSNSKDKVVRVLPAAFESHYPGKGFAVFFGKFR